METQVDWLVVLHIQTLVTSEKGTDRGHRKILQDDQNHEEAWITWWKYVKSYKLWILDTKAHENCVTNYLITTCHEDETNNIVQSTRFLLKHGVDVVRQFVKNLSESEVDTILSQQVVPVVRCVWDGD